jgi:hypothetical protein
MVAMFMGIVIDTNTIQRRGEKQTRRRGTKRVHKRQGIKKEIEQGFYAKAFSASVSSSPPSIEAN